MGDGNDGVAVVDEVTENGGEGLRRVERGVVEQHDAPRLYPGGHPLADGLCVVVLPVQGVPVGKDLKPLRRKGLQVGGRCASGKNLTWKRGVWRVIQAREGSNSRGCARGWVVVERWGRMRYTKNRIGQRPLAGYCTYMVEDAFVALNYRFRGLPQKNQSDLTQTARTPLCRFLILLPIQMLYLHMFQRSICR